MNLMLAMWIVWAGLATLLLALLAYRGTLTRYEEDCLFLGDCNGHEKLEQEKILLKVRKVQPMVRIVTIATCGFSAALLGVYVWEALQQFYV